MRGKVDFIVRVLGSESTAEPLFRGTGLLIAPDCVLTCRHVVMEQTPYGQPTDTPLPQLWVQRAAGPRLLVEKPVLAANWDLAVLELATALPVEPPPFLWGLSQVLEEKLRAAPLVVIGYTQTEKAGPLWQHPLKDLWLLPSLRESSQILTTVQLHGGIPAGCSGAPVLLPLGDQWATAGIVYLGGEHAATSRLILADPVVEFLHQCGLHRVARLDAVRALADPAAVALIERPGVGERLPNPYRGLAAFRALDAPYFFGREDASEALWTTVRENRFVALVGASGSGKSSLLFAGLVPRVRQKSDWHLIAFRPGRNPFDGVATALTPLLYPELDKLARWEKRNHFLQQLNDGRLSMADGMALFAEEHPDQRLLVIVDQFEELYTQNLPQAQQRRFLESLMTVIQGELPSGVLLALRADFLNQALGYAPLAAAMARYPKHLVTLMTETQLRAAIEGPAGQLGVSLEPGLTERILKDLGEEPGTLPLLEFALTELWQRQAGGRLTHGAYEALGGVSQALAHHADRVAAPFHGREAQLRRVFVQLVRPGEGTEDTRQVATREQIGEGNWPLVKELADQRLVVTSAYNEGQQTVETVEIVHEALIRHWQPLRDWIDQNRQFRVWQNRLRQTLQEWEDKQRDEGALLRGARLTEAEERLKDHADELSPAERAYLETSIGQRTKERMARRRVQRRLIGGLATSLVIFFSLFLWANFERHHAREEQAKAEAQKQVALARQLAAEAIDEFHKQNGLSLLRSGLLVIESLTHVQTVQGYLAWESVMKRLPRKLFQLRHQARVYDYNVTLSPDGRYLATASEDNTVHVWDAATGQELTVFHQENVFEVVFNPASSLLATAGRGTIRLWDVLSGQESIRLNQDAIGNPIFSPDGRFLATSSTTAVTKEWFVIVWNVATGQELARLPHKEWLYSVAFSPDSRRLATLAHRENTVHLWDTSTWHQIRQLVHDGPVWRVTFAPDGSRIATTSSPNEHGVMLHIWDPGNGKEITQFSYESGEGRSADSTTFSPDLKQLAVGLFTVENTPDGVAVVDLESRKTILHVDREPWLSYGSSGSTVVKYSPDGKQLLSISYGGVHGQQAVRIRLWDVASGKELFSLPISDISLDGNVIFDPTGKRLIAADGGTSVVVWDLTTTNNLFESKSGLSFPYLFLPCSDDREIISVQFENDTLIVQDRFGKVLTRLTPIDKLNGLGISTEADRLLTWKINKKEEPKGLYVTHLQVWDTKTGRELASLIEPELALANFSPDGTRITTRLPLYRDPKTFRLWNAVDGREVAKITLDEAIGELKFSPQGSYLTAITGDKTVRVWTTQSGRQVLQLVHDPAVSSVAFTPDGRRIVTADRNKIIRIWDLVTGKELLRFDQEAPVDCIVFSPDGGKMATHRNLFRNKKDSSDTEGENTITIWDTSTGQKLADLEHEGPVFKASFSPDGVYLATTSQDQIARVWEVTSGRELARMNHEARVGYASFSPDGRLTTVMDSILSLWPWHREDLMAELCSRLTRNLTREEWRTYLGDEPYRPTCPDLPVPKS